MALLDRVLLKHFLAVDFKDLDLVLHAWEAKI